MVHNARRAEFIRESYYADGGSVGFNFLTMPRGQFEIIVMHRQNGMGGNPGFQEIFIRLGRKRTVIEPESRLEKDVVVLLSAAVIRTNHLQVIGEPKNERLQWLVERIKNRTTPW
jgi:hypothetical protein